jgi:hypothetical protein
MQHQQAAPLHQFINRWKRLFFFRAGLQAATVWFFVWGVVVLAAKFSGVRDNQLWPVLGLLGAVPLMILAGLLACRKIPAPAKFSANYDRLNTCGGIIMSEEVADMSAWREMLPAMDAPRFRWRSGRATMLLSLSVVFAAVALLLPERLTHLINKQQLQIGQVVEQLQVEVKTLNQEKIIEDKKAEDLQKQLAQLQKDSSSVDPNKTWEALDHIKEANTDVAKQAAEEAVSKTTALSQAETLAQAMQQAADAGMNEATASQAAQELSAILKSAKLEEGVLSGQIPPELIADLKGLNKEDMESLMKALASGKSSISNTVNKLSSLKMISLADLAKCNKAGHCNNPGALIDFLSTCTNGGCCSTDIECFLLGRGGPGGGGPAAPMTWDNNTSEDNQKFQEHALPPASQLSDAQMVGVSKAAPELSGADVSAQHGALANAAGSGGSAHAQVILPEHRQAVQNFFKRDEK